MTEDEAKIAALKFGIDMAKATRRATIEECAKVAEAKAAEYLSPEYATGQPMSSFSERFACGQIADAIRSLTKAGKGE